MTAKISDFKSGTRRKIKQVISVDGETVRGREGGREMRACDIFRRCCSPLRLQCLYFRFTCVDASTWRTHSEDCAITPACVVWQLCTLRSDDCMQIVLGWIVRLCIKLSKTPLSSRRSHITELHLQENCVDVEQPLCRFHPLSAPLIFLLILLSILLHLSFVFLPLESLFSRTFVSEALRGV